MMDSTILLFLIQDGLITGTIYALLGLALVPAFAVARTISIPKDEFAAYGGLTFALLSTGAVPGTIRLLVVFAIAAFVAEFGANVTSLRCAGVGGISRARPCCQSPCCW